MKFIAWLITILLVTFMYSPLRGQSLNLVPNQNWSSPNKEISVPTISHTVIDTNTYCLYDKVERIDDKCVNNWRGFDNLIEEPYVGVKVPIVNNRTHQTYKYNRKNYIYNFKGHISASVGMKLSEMSISKFRVEWESDTRTENWTYGGLISFYTLKYYYVGVRPEVFARYYFVPNTSGEGAFIQGRFGWGRFWGDGKVPFGGLGFGVDVGKKVILIGNDHDYSNSFTLTPMAGVQAYPGPDGLSPVSWVWQLRFGYQFGGGMR
jgi:hypothetical protein